MQEAPRIGIPNSDGSPTGDPHLDSAIRQQDRTWRCGLDGEKIQGKLVYTTHWDPGTTRAHGGAVTALNVPYCPGGIEPSPYQATDTPDKL